MTVGARSRRERDPGQQHGRSFSCAVRRLPAGTTVIRATGDPNSETNSQLYLLIADALLREPTLLVLDLSDLTSVDDAAIDTLLSASAVAGESDISFCLVAPHASPVITTLTATGLIERFEIFPTVCAATANQ